MKKLINDIQNYIPCNDQELNDKYTILKFLENNDDSLFRENKIAHFSASAWVTNKQRNKILMVYHNLFNSFAWPGGHADGYSNLFEVAQKEVLEETGIKIINPIQNDIFSLEILTVDGHIKNKKYVSSHLHLNLTYYFEADENEMLIVKPDENSKVEWIDIKSINDKVSEPWMLENIYHKLLNKMNI